MLREIKLLSAWHTFRFSEAGDRRVVDWQISITGGNLSSSLQLKGTPVVLKNQVHPIGGLNRRN